MSRTLHPTEQVQKAWISHGQMNGDNDSLMQSLKALFLRAGAIGSEHGPQLLEIETGRSYMAELWLRDVSKLQFLAYAGAYEATTSWTGFRNSNADDITVMRWLKNSLPASIHIDANDLDEARTVMAELWIRGVSKNDFLIFMDWN